MSFSSSSPAPETPAAQPQSSDNDVNAMRMKLRQLLVEQLMGRNDRSQMYQQNARVMARQLRGKY